MKSSAEPGPQRAACRAADLPALAGHGQGAGVAQRRQRDRPGGDGQADERGPDRPQDCRHGAGAERGGAEAALPDQQCGAEADDHSEHAGEQRLGERDPHERPGRGAARPQQGRVPAAAVRRRPRRSARSPGRPGWLPGRRGTGTGSGRKARPGGRCRAPRRDCRRRFRRRSSRLSRLCARAATVSNAALGLPGSACESVRVDLSADQLRAARDHRRLHAGELGCGQDDHVVRRRGGLCARQARRPSGTANRRRAGRRLRRP